MFCFGHLIFAQNKPDFAHKSIRKQLAKYKCSKDYQLKEIRIPDEIQGGEDVNGSYFKLEDSHCKRNATYLFVGRVNTCRSGGCQVHYENKAGAQYENFDYFIIYNQNIEVEKVKVFRYEATHGHEISAKRWLKQFIGYRGEKDLVVGKDIDGISGATTSVYCITYDLQERSKRLNEAIAFYALIGMHPEWFIW